MSVFLAPLCIELQWMGGEYLLQVHSSKFKVHGFDFFYRDHGIYIKSNPGVVLGGGQCPPLELAWSPLGVLKCKPGLLHCMNIYLWFKKNKINVNVKTVCQCETSHLQGWTYRELLPGSAAPTSFTKLHSEFKWSCSWLECRLHQQLCLTQNDRHT